MQENANIPAFLGKLWRMVNDPSTDHLISWSEAGNTFIVQNQVQFWYELLPLYYKHNNMSSFVRQLNMYGFHKISNLENPGLGSEKDDGNVIQFYHPFFQKDKPDKLKNIKRKVTTSKSSEVQGVIRHDDLTKVLTDVKQLRGRQSSVDSQLSAMRQENAVLWRELALLRQKHMKQQQIVNKLIQFLVTLVQPSAPPRMGVGVKRRIPLMLHESPAKKARSKKASRLSDGGPTIHELDAEVELSPEQLLQEAAVIEDDIPLEEVVASLEKTTKIDSPITPGSQDSPMSQQMTSPLPQDQDIQSHLTNTQQCEPACWQKPEFVSIDDEISDNEEDLIDTLQKNAGTVDEVFLNPNNSDALIGNLVNRGYNENVLGGKNMRYGRTTSSSKQSPTVPSQPNMQLATKNSAVKINNGDELDVHLDHTQSELDQLKDILNGCNTFDANALLGLFTDNNPDYGIRSTVQNKENPTGVGADSGKLTQETNLIDFNALFDDDLDNQDEALAVQPALLETSNDFSGQSTSLNTPLVIKNEPVFPSST